MDDKVLQELYNTVVNRKNNPTEGSYTCYLFDKGLDKILKKVLQYYVNRFKILGGHMYVMTQKMLHI